MVRSTYRLLSTVLEPLIYVWLKMRQRRGKESRQRFTERLGKASIERPNGKLVWIHCASVGESQSALQLIETILDTYPHVFVLVTTGTVTSADYMQKRLPEKAIHQFVPVDVPRYVKRFLKYWQPDVGLWFESELWPNLVVQAGHAHVKMILVNGRMSERSIARWRKWPLFIRTLLRQFQQLLVQTEQDKMAYESLGGVHVKVTGNLKFAARPLPVDEQALQALQQEIDRRPVWLAASTHEGEEIIAGHVHAVVQKKYKEILTIIVLRHPNRMQNVYDSLHEMGFRVAVRSKQDKIYPDTDIYLVDTLGELGLFFRMTEIIFMGGSLAEIGGHNLLEPAQLSSVVLHGPHMFLQQDIMDAFRQAQASIEVKDEDALANQITALLNDGQLRKDYIQKTATVAASKAEVLETVTQALEPILNATLVGN